MSDLISDPPQMKVGVITEQGLAEARVCDLTDAQLENAIGNTAADLALAEKYQHNAHLRPLIRAHFDVLNDERKRRGSSAEPAPPTGKFRKKPTLIDAVRYAYNEYADNPLTFHFDHQGEPEWLRAALRDGLVTPEFRTEDYWYVRITTANGNVYAGPGDWICHQQVNGKADIWPCAANIFEATYDAA